MCFHRFSASWEILGAQKAYVFTGFLPSDKSWEFKNHMFSQVFCLLGRLGGCKNICFHRFSASWEILGAQTPCVFTGVLPPGKSWVLKKHVFSQVICLLGYRRCSKTMCFHRFSAFWKNLGAQKTCVFTNCPPSARPWGLQNNVFSQVFCLLGSLGD